MSAAEANQLFIFTQWTDMMSEFARNGRQSTVVLPSDFSATASMFEQMLVAQETEGADEFVIVEEEEKYLLCRAASSFRVPFVDFPRKAR